MEGLEHESAQAVGEHLSVNEKVGLFEGDKVSFAIEADPGNNIMDVGVQEHVLLPTLQHGEETALEKSGTFGVGEDLLEGPGGGREEQLVKGPGMGVGVLSQLAGQGEGDQEIRHGEQAIEVRSGPCGVIGSAAGGTQSVVAAVPGEVHMAAAVAPEAMATHRFGAAQEDVLQGLERSFGQVVAVTAEEMLAESIKNFRNSAVSACRLAMSPG